MNYQEKGINDVRKVAATNRRPGPNLMDARSLTGNDVCNRSGESLGDIKEIMLDIATGRIAYAVLAYGGFLGIGEKLFAVPWSALRLDMVYARFTLNLEKDQLKIAPGFDKNNWPDMADETWAKTIHDYYGVTPYPDGQI